MSMAESNFTKMRVPNNIEKADEEKKVQRKKKILILICDFLERHGYSGSATYLSSEVGFNVGRFSVCDNMDLEIILQEFETFYNMKYGKNAQIYKLFDETKVSEKKFGPKRARQKCPLTISLAPTETYDPKMNNNFVDCDRRQGDILQPLGPYATFPMDNEYRILAGIVAQELLVQRPCVFFDDVIGHENAKVILKESLIYPIKYPELYSIVNPWRGLLLFGPTGTGKTMLAKAAATECQSTFFNVSAAIFTSKWRGESEKMIKVLFELARFHAPSIIFFDEVDAVMSQRSPLDHEASRRFKSEFLIQMDGLDTGNDSVFVLAASNAPWELDPAFLRRMECRQYISPPNHQVLKDIFHKYLPPSLKYASYTIPIVANYDALADAGDGYTGADIFLLCKRVKLIAVRKIVAILEKYNSENKNHEFSPITLSDLVSVLHTVKPVHSNNLEKYELFANSIL